MDLYATVQNGASPSPYAHLGLGFSLHTPSWLIRNRSPRLLVARHSGPLPSACMAAPYPTRVGGRQHETLGRRDLLAEIIAAMQAKEIASIIYSCTNSVFSG